MSYATIADLKKTLPESELIKLCNDSGGSTFDTAAQAVAQWALDAGTSEIDEALAELAGSLLSSDRRRDLCLDIAAYRLVVRRALDTEKGPYAVRRQVYEDALAFMLEKKKEAKVSETAGAGIAGGVSGDSRTSVFSDDSLSRF